MKHLATILLCLAPLVLAADRGSSTMRLEECQLPLETAAPDAVNYVDNGNLEKPTTVSSRGWHPWYGASNLQGLPKERLAATREARDRMATREIRVDEKGNHYFHLVTSEEIRSFQDAKGEPTITNAVSYRAAVPGKGRYLLRFRAAGHNLPGPGVNRFLLIPTFLDQKFARIQKDKLIRFQATDQWAEYSYPLEAPEGTVRISLSFFLYGAGELKLDDFSLTSADGAQTIETTLYPMGWIDNCYHLASGQTGILQIVTRNPGNLPIKKPELLIEMPRGVEITGSSAAIAPKALGDGKWRVDLRRSRITKEWYSLPPLLLRTTLPPQKQPLEVRYRFVNDGKPGPECKFNLVVIPPFTGKPPRIFRHGPFSSGLNANYNGKDAVDVVGLYRQTGFNLLHSLSQDMSREAKKAGFLRLRWATVPGPNDGYDMGENPKPPEVWFLGLDGKPLPALRNKPYLLCPVAVYTNSEYYRQKVVAPLRKQMVEQDFYDFVSNNWEPQVGFRGCFCERCREEFIRHTRLPAAEVRAAWPSQVLEKWRDQWVEFRAWQHGRLVAQVEKDVAAFGKEAGRDLHFAPQITSGAFREARYRAFAQYNPEYFLKDLPWINAWGPYVYRDLSTPASYTNAEYLKCWLAAQDVQEFTARRIPDPAKRPRYIALPHALQCGWWVTTPEALALETLCYFLNRWAAAEAYIFPLGYDHRWFRELARVNTAIAATEDVVFQGKPLPPPDLAALTPLPKNCFAGTQHSDFPRLPTASLLQGAAYVLGERRLVAVGNFWQKAPVFVRLRIADLDPRRQYLLWQPAAKEAYLKEAGKPYTGAELARGITLEVPPLHWNLYLVEPWRPADGLAVVAEGQRETARQKALPEIQRLIQWEAEQLQSTGRAEPAPDYSILKPVQAGGLTLKPDGSRAVVTAPGYTLAIDLAQGGAVTSWKIGGAELVFPQKGLLAAEGTWERPFQCSRPFHPVAARAEGGAIVLEAERTLTKQDTPFFPRLRIRKRYRLTAKGLELSTTIKNTTGEEMTLDFRWWNLFADGRVTLDGPKGNLPLVRTYDVRAYQVATQVRPVLFPRNPNKTIPTFPVAAPKARVTFPGAVIEMTASPREAFNAFVVWDGTNAPATLEPLYHPFTLNAGQEASFTLQLTIRK